jgi:hypothetical protein
MSNIIVSSPKGTKKIKNLQSNPNVSIIIDIVDGRVEDLSYPNTSSPPPSSSNNNPPVNNLQPSGGSSNGNGGGSGSSSKNNGGGSSSPGTSSPSK